MLSVRRYPARVALAIVAVLVLVLAISLRSPSARATDLGALQGRITSGQSRISSLSGAVRKASGQIDRLDAGIAVLERQLTRIQAQVSAKLAELAKLRLQLQTARTRLAALEAFAARGERTLAQQLVDSYETTQPDLVTVIIESTGFQDLLERLQFANRIQRQDVTIVTRVRAERRTVAAQAVTLGALEVRQQQLTAQVVAARDSLARTQLTLFRQRVVAAKARAAKAGQLANARSQVARLEQQVAQIQAQQSGQSAPRIPSAGTFGAPTVSSGGFVFPLPKSAASPPSTWSPDQGVDISAPGDTPEYAVCSGTIVLHGIGGFGPWAPVLHCDSPLDGYSYVYYGHAGPENQLPVGTHVGAGQVMSSIGPGIVGISTGPHLEIGFADSSGSPIGSQTAGTMLALLQSAY